MKYITYAVMAVFSLILTAFAMLIAPVLPIFAKNENGPLDNATSYGQGMRLPQWMSWLMTPDNSLEGDGGWKNEHWQWRFKFPAPIASYIGYVGWLWRNPAYSFGMKYIDGTQNVTMKGDNSIGDNQTAKEGSVYVECEKLFQYVYIKRIFNTNKCVYVNLGWNIRALLDPNNRKINYRATLAFSPRVSGFYPK